MAIKVKGLEIETGKLYDEYTKEELEVLPSLDSETKRHWRLDENGEWYFSEYDD